MGSGSWQSGYVPLTEGVHTLRWEYYQEVQPTFGSTGHAWVDQVVVYPTVTVTAGDATATEAGPTTGQFTVSRNHILEALTVDFAVSGTATPGSDYAGLGTSVTIPAGP